MGIPLLVLLLKLIQNRHRLDFVEIQKKSKFQVFKIYRRFSENFTRYRGHFWKILPIIKKRENRTFFRENLSLVRFWSMQFSYPATATNI